MFDLGFAGPLGRQVRRDTAIHEGTHKGCPYRGIVMLIEGRFPFR